MAITDAGITRDGVRAIITGDSAVVTYRARFKINTDDPDDGPVYILNNAAGNDDIPSKWDTFDVDGETDASAYALDFDLTKNPQLNTQWFLDVTWRKPGPGDDSGQNVANPINRTPVYWWEAEEELEVVTEARNVNAFTHLTTTRPAGTLGPVVNAANREFATTWERPVSYGVLNMRRWYSSLDAVRSAISIYANKLNDDAWQGAAARELYVRNILTGEPVQEFGGTYYQAVFRIAYKPGGWIKELVNQGHGYFDGSNNYISVDDDGSTYVEPVLLDTDGTRLADDATGNTVDYYYADETSFNSSETDGTYTFATIASHPTT